MVSNRQGKKMLRYAKSKKGSKSKRKGSKNTGTKVQQWKRCNAAHDPRGAEYVDSEREYGNGGTQYRGHTHLPNCGCQKALGPRPKSESEIVRAQQLKMASKRLQKQVARNAECPIHHTMLPITGQCDECDAAA
jgi:hypothetical protein